MTQLNYQSVLVPTDFSEQANAAVRVALDMVADPSYLTVLHVAPPLDAFSAGDPAVVWNSVSDDSRREYLMDTFTEQFSEPAFSKTHFEVAFGPPAEEITKYASDHGSELIMLPSHGRTGLARMMIGSVAERVVRLAHCPVLVLRT